LLLLFLLVLFRQTAAENAAGHRADNGVMTRVMAGDTADHRSFDAPFRIGLRRCEGEH
jgi:hypothetical protein